METQVLDTCPAKTNSPQPTIPTEWTAFNLSTRPVVQSNWIRHDAPSELSLLQETLKLPPKLVEIINWSLQRTPATEPHQPSTALDVSKLSPDDGPANLTSAPQLHQEDRLDTRSVCSDAQSRRSSSLERSIPRLRNFTNDLVNMAVTKVTALKEKHEKDRAASTKTLQRHRSLIEKATTGECTSCFDDLPTNDLVKLSCTHSYCKPCLTTLILTALQNESAFPPKCCLSEIPPATIIIPLDRKQQELYKEKSAEYSIPADRRWYCPNTKCLKWIPPTKLHRSRMSAQRCPHCQTRICGMCRGLAHARHVDCPQDFGLEATISIAESEGWRRCHNCRTMVERTTGYRHITCQCGAEFCYVCGSCWRTCNCTEVDEANRQALLRRQRQERDAVDQAEADEVARAVAVVEALVREEAETRRLREEEEERERQREEAELARLEQIRLEEEAARKREREEAERHLRDILKLSIQEDVDVLMSSLMDLLHAQYIALDNRQGAEEQNLTVDFEKANAILENNAEMLQTNMKKNVNRRMNELKAKQEEELILLEQTQEEKEDDVFLQIQTHLKGKPNREAREKRLLEGMKKDQEAERKEVEAKHAEQIAALEGVAKMEVEGLKRSGDSRRRKAKMEFDEGVGKMLATVGVERKWFEQVWERRVEMVKEHGRIMGRELEGGVEPIGLTEESAKTVRPLTLRVEVEDEKESLVSNEQEWVRDSVQHTPVELEAPITVLASARRATPSPNPFDTATGSQQTTSPVEIEQRATSRDSHTTAASRRSFHEYDDLVTNPWTWAMNGRAPEIPRRSSARPTDLGTHQQQVPQSLRPGRSAVPAPASTVPASVSAAGHLYSQPVMQTPIPIPMPMPQSGNAYLSTKHGECSRPIYDIDIDNSSVAPPLPLKVSRPAALPTPPESPLVSTITNTQSTQSTSSLRSLYPQLEYREPATSMAELNNLTLRVPSRLSYGSISVEPSVPATPTEGSDHISVKNSQVDASSKPKVVRAKPKKIAPAPMMMGGMYMDSFLDLSVVKNKEPAEVLGARKERLDAAGGSGEVSKSSKSSRWPFRKKDISA